MQLPRESIEPLLKRAYSAGLLRRLSIDYDHESWMAGCREKGCLVVMVCIEASDHRRRRPSVIDRFCKIVSGIRDGIINKGQIVDHVYLVPNAHPGPRRKPGTNWRRNVRLLQELKAALVEPGFDAQLNSFGCGKTFHFFVNAHKLGHVLRTI